MVDIQDFFNNVTLTDTGGNWLTATDIASDINIVISDNTIHYHCTNDTSREGVNI